MDIRLTKFSTDQLLAALALLNASDPVKSGVPEQEIERAKRRILRKLIRRPGLEFDVWKR